MKSIHLIAGARPNFMKIAPLVRAMDARKDEISLEFDQPVVWIDALAGQFYLDGKPGQVASGTVSGNLIKLKLAAPSTAKTITYVQDRRWDPKTLLYGKNGIAALTFCDVGLEAVEK